MRRDVAYLIVILILLAFVVVLTCTAPPKHDPSANIYADSVKELKTQKAEISSRFEAIEKASIIRQKSDSSKLAASLREISRLKVKASQARTPKVDTLIIENPDLEFFVNAQDSVILAQSVLIDTLKSNLEFERNVREQLVELHYDSDKISASLQELSEQRIVTLEKDLKKEKRKGRGWKALAVVGAVVGILVGSNL